MIHNKFIQFLKSLRKAKTTLNGQCGALSKATYITTNLLDRISAGLTESYLLIDCQQEMYHPLWFQILHSTKYKFDK